MHVLGLYNQSQYILNSLLLICQRTPIATCNRRIYTTPITHVNRGPKLLKLIS